MKIIVQIYASNCHKQRVKELMFQFGETKTLATDGTAVMLSCMCEFQQSEQSQPRSETVWLLTLMRDSSLDTY